MTLTIWMKSPHNHEVHFLLLSCNFLPSISTFFIVRPSLGYSLVRHPLFPHSLPLQQDHYGFNIPKTSIPPSPVNSSADPALLPTLYLIRHCQVERNVNPQRVPSDTILIDTGQPQAAGLRVALHASSRLQIDAIVASPLKRALQTALIGFEDLIAQRQ